MPHILIECQNGKIIVLKISEISWQLKKYLTYLFVFLLYFLLILIFIFKFSLFDYFIFYFSILCFFEYNDFISFFNMGRKGRNYKNFKSIIVTIDDKTFSIELDSNEKIKNEDDLKQISTNPPDQNRNKNRNKDKNERRNKKKQIQQTNQNEHFQLQINEDSNEMQFGDNMVDDDDFPFLNEFNTFYGIDDFQLANGLNEDSYFDTDDFQNFDIFN